ncbi:MAG TPA: aminotransferase class I/II-fold pyridoxal phosphate-dependent enzyme [Candidatus Avidehalobacter gallistercoris]|uniref:Aminotransferase n=1 Tax=Candidatus Avidehalobacter gallistercoris TaxID=2840694 RepID=A0A9D1HJM8_9FIRM|nr:aminotransferase class I/II-fold pyridoxal phosphate-dependent enzyme [Candidatus Avidehalobacter gallistercoris]
MKKYLNRQVAAIQPSAIRKFFDLAATIPDVVSLGIGEPDFATPKQFCDAGYRSMLEGKTGYSPNPGILELRQAISNYLAGLIGVEYDPYNQIVVTVGGSEAIDATFRAIIEPGDEVIIPEPAFVSYAPCVELAGGKVIHLPLTMQEGFKLSPERLEAAITPKTKAVVLNFPCNPTGVVMTQEELNALAAPLIKHEVLAISDEIYAELLYDGRKHASIAAAPGMQDLTVLISGFSKSLAMTGWRIGYVCANPELLNGIYKIHQFSISCASTTGQYVALEGIARGHAEVERMVEEYDKRRQFIIRRFAEIGLPMCEPDGAFYAFPQISGTGLSSGDFCEQLLKQEKVACIHGSAFGDSGEGFIRCSYATSMENIARACDGIDRFVNGLK